MRLPLAALLTLVVALRPVQAQTVAPAADSLGPKIDRVFARFDRADSPGCAVGVGMNGQDVYARGYGSANLEYGVPITKESIFESGSVAKQFTASAIVLLAQEGKLSLEDDIRKYLPEVPDFGETIRIRHLLNHTSGLRDQWGLLGIEGRGPGTQVHSAATTLDLVAHQKALNFPPGTEYLYSNTGFSLLGVIVQRVSGQSLSDFTQARLFGPLGMTHTRWRDDFTAIVKGRTTAYSGTQQGGFRTNMSFTNMIGNGGLLTTVGDLLIWNRNLDDHKVGGPAYVSAMQTQGILRSGRKISYALGLDVGSYAGVSEVSHSGSTAGYSTFLARYPDQHLSVAVLCNLSSSNPVALARQVADLFLPKAPFATPTGTAAVSLSQAQLDRWAGLYVERSTDRPLRMTARDGKLFAGEGANSAVTPSAENRFRSGSGLPAELVFAGTAGSRTALMIRPAGDTSRFTEVRVAAPSAQTLGDFVGTYASDELDVKLVVAIKDGGLVLRRRPADEMPMRPVYADDFDSQLGSLRFLRDARGRVTGFGIFAGRVRDVRFRRVGP
jgi:CubicO group peptidase (beta-lactamase class C family)